MYDIILYSLYHCSTGLKEAEKTIETDNVIGDKGRTQPLLESVVADDNILVEDGEGSKNNEDDKM